ncbi:MAG: malate dehydrogenase [endosymbiont of Galathealinum brachiosum]|uniref:Malate dehydrogenase n=1 Tax=endosymbiont of Galathealinum brachiosum TaxID=2200906 RepID=A0A370DCB0_9GAMM|nr:MAG: malate dehydrogenase [endosymbiont of Galathealinum brachiosum]
MKKITVVGAGRVGESTAQFIASKDLCREIVLIDIREGAAEGAALDIQEDAPLFRFDTRLTGGTDYSLMADSDLIIITAGVPRKPGMSRSDVLETNVRVTDSIIENTLKYAPNSKMLFVSNPVDILTYRAWQKTGWDRSRILGQAGVLDSTRMASFIAMETGYSALDIDAMVLGGHGDSMVPMMRFTTISGIPVSNFMDQKTIDDIVTRTRNGGAEILALRQNSSAFDAPAAAVAAMVDAIVNDRKRILPTVAILKNEYGCDELAIGVPCVLGKNGMEKVITLEMNKEEQLNFDRSVEAVEKDMETLSKL